MFKGYVFTKAHLALTHAAEYGRDSAAQPAADAPTARAHDGIVLLQMSEVIGAALHSIVQRMECGFSFLNWISHFIFSRLVHCGNHSVFEGRCRLMDDAFLSPPGSLAPSKEHWARGRDVQDCMPSWLWNRQLRAINSGA
ncbi:hypothetical protein [Caballeronia sp. INML1]|uniref:hypothetical protein n=1 Tax=Caballeronia sp. INML1 TaxID=2921760 RepID=UPI002027740F|nr:hypothetical protein [Caballeronia sp. INML1]